MNGKRKISSCYIRALASRVAPGFLLDPVFPCFSTTSFVGIGGGGNGHGSLFCVNEELGIEDPSV